MAVQGTARPRSKPRQNPHTLSNRIARVLWGVVQGTIFRWIPRPLHPARAFVLRLFGADVSMRARVYPKAKIWGPWNLTMEDYATLADDVNCYCVERITIGAGTTVSQYSYLCGATHDHTDPLFPLVPAPITIGRKAWIAADVFVAPGISIGDGTVVGARSSVFADLPAWSVCVGSPAKRISARLFKDGSHPPEAEQEPEASGSTAASHGGTAAAVPERIDDHDAGEEPAGD